MKVWLLRCAEMQMVVHGKTARAKRVLQHYNSRRW